MHNIQTQIDNNMFARVYMRVYECKYSYVDIENKLQKEVLK